MATRCPQFPDGKFRSRFIDDQGTLYYTITLTFRTGASFASTPLSTEIDGITYTIYGDDDLSSSDITMVERVDGIDVTGLPALSTGYEYRSFHLSTDTYPRAFMWVQVGQVSP